MDFSNLEPVQMYCPNCGHKITGYKSDDGFLNTICNRCRLSISRKRKNSKKVSIEISNPYADEGEF